MASRRHFMTSVAGVGAACFGAPLFGCRRGGALRIGGILGLSGEDSSLGVETRQGIEIALAEINEAGGFQGRKLEVLFEDTRLDPNLASEKIQKLIDRDGVVCVIGDAASTPTLSAGAYAEKARVPLISGSATNVEVTRGKKWVFRVCFTDDKQGTAAARFAREELKFERAGILYVTGNKYSEGLAQIFAEEFAKRGGKVVAKVTFQAQETNVVSFLTRLKEADPQIVFAPVYPSDVAKIGPTKRTVGLDAPLLGTDGWNGPATRAKGVVEAIEGSYFTDLFAADGPLAAARPFVEKFKTMHGRVPSALSAAGYDTMKLVFDALGRAKAPTPEALRDALEATRGFRGVTGTFDIDETHSAQKPVTVMRILNGDFKYFTTIALT